MNSLVGIAWSSSEDEDDELGELPEFERSHSDDSDEPLKSEPSSTDVLQSQLLDLPERLAGEHLQPVVSQSSRANQQ